MVSKAKEHHTRVEQKIIPLLSALPKEFINIVFNWTVEDMEDVEDKETIPSLEPWFGDCNSQYETKLFP